MSHTPCQRCGKSIRIPNRFLGEFRYEAITRQCDSCITARFTGVTEIDMRRNGIDVERIVRRGLDVTRARIR